MKTVSKHQRDLASSPGSSQFFNVTRRKTRSGSLGTRLREIEKGGTSPWVQLPVGVVYTPTSETVSLMLSALDISDLGVLDRESLCFSLAVAVCGGGETVKAVEAASFLEDAVEEVGGEPERETVKVVRCCSNHDAFLVFKLKATEVWFCIKQRR